VKITVKTTVKVTAQPAMLRSGEERGGKPGNAEIGISGR
jgi:hypothetical protein